MLYRGKFHILAAEDNEDDQLFLQKAFNAVKGPLSLSIVGDGEEVMHYMLREPPFEDSLKYPFPNLLMLDIKMPKHTGLDVLHWIMHTDKFRRVPVMIVSGSNLQQDIDRAFDLGASSYLVKPMSVEKMRHVFQTTADFWTTVSEWPSPPRS